MRSPSSWSLRRRIYGVATVAILVAWLAGGAALYSSAQREYERMCHQNLANLAGTVLSFSEHELHEVLADAAPQGDTAPVHAETVSTLGRRYAYQIWSSHGSLLLRSYYAPDHEPIAPSGTRGLHQTTLGGKPIDVFVLHSANGDMEIQVADTGEDALLVAPSFARDVLLALLVAMVPVLLVTWWMIRNAFGAMQTMTQQLAQRGVSNLDPLPLGSSPSELVPVISGVNGLLGVIANALDRERGFTALAAHEMRTPLASMRMQAQVIARAESGDDRRRGVALLTENVDRCARLLTQLLALARADAQHVKGVARESVRLDAVCAEVLQDFIEQVEARGIALECAFGVEALAADKVALHTLLRNLVSNALRHTPDAGSVRISTEPRGDAVLLSVEDSGSGIPEFERDKVLQRFYRGAGQMGSGVGLGLSIVASIVQAHRAALRLCDSSFGGLRVEVLFAPRG